MTPAQNNLNQQIPQSINSGEKSVLNISTITADESSRQMIVSPVSNTYAPHRHHNHDRLITHTTEEQKVTQKQKRLNESGDSSKIIALTTGTESQPEQQEYDPEDGDRSKQNHDVQTGPEQQNY